MKRTLHLWLLIVAVSALVSNGCKGKSEAPSAAPSAVPAPAASEPGPAATAPAAAPATPPTPPPAPTAQPSEAPAAPIAVPAEDAEGHRNWNCKKACKLAFDCKSRYQYDDADRCEFDCTSVASDKGGRFLRGALAGAAYYTCIDKISDCAGIKKCDHIFDSP